MNVAVTRAISAYRIGADGDGQRAIESTVAL